MWVSGIIQCCTEARTFSFNDDGGANIFWCVGALLRLSSDAARVNNRLKELGGLRNWSQADLADELGVSRQSVNAIETGKYDPSLPLAFRIAHLFDLSIESIFEDENST